MRSGSGGRLTLTPSNPPRCRKRALLCVRGERERGRRWRSDRRPAAGRVGSAGGRGEPAARRADRAAQRRPVAISRAGCADHLRRRVRRDDARAQHPRGRVSGLAYAGLAHPAGRRAAVDHLHCGRAPAAPDEPGQRVQPRRAGPLGGARRPRAGGGPAGEVGLPVRAQGRRAGPGSGVRAGPADPGRDPGGRPGGRGRDRERQDDQGDPGAADRCGSARGARGPGRGLLRGGGVRRAERGSGGRR